MKKRKTLSFLLMSMMLCLLCLQPIHADVGNSFGGGSSGGGGGGGGGDYSSSYDDDYDGGGTINASPGTVLVLSGLFGVVFCGLIIGANRLENKGLDEDSTVAAIKRIDEEFSPLEFKEFANQVWFNVQRAWQDKDFDTMRNIESDALYHVHAKQLEEYVKNRKTNRLTNQKIKDTKIAKYERNGDYDCIHVKIHATIRDYVVNDDNGKTIEGSSSTTYIRDYDLTFIRRHGVKSKGSYSDTLTKCPNCGADIKLSSSGQCEYCKSVVTNGDHKWVLNAYGPWDRHILD